MKIIIKNDKTEKRRTSVYFDKALVAKVFLIAKDNGISFNATMTYLVETAIKTGELNNG